MGFHGGSDGKESACNAGATRDEGSNPGLGRSPVEGLGNPLQYSCLENPMDRGAWWATVHGVTKSWTRLKQLSMHALPAMQETQVQSLGREDSPGDGSGKPLQYSCLGESQGQRSL